MRIVVLFLLCCSLLVPASSLAGPIETDTDRPGADYYHFDMSKPGAKFCQDACMLDMKCKAWTYAKPNVPGITGSNAHCWLKDSVPQAVANSCCTSGTNPTQIPTFPVTPIPPPVKPIITPVPIPPVFNPDVYRQLGMTNMVNLCFLIDCSPPPDPVIMSLINAPVEPGKKLVITGEGFMDDPGTVLIDSYFRAANREIHIDQSNWRDKTISVDIPGDIEGIVDHDAQIRVKTWDGRLSIAIPVRFKAAQDLKRALNIRIEKCDSDFSNTMNIVGEDSCEWIPPKVSEPWAYIIYVAHFPDGDGHDKFFAGPWINGYLFDRIDFQPDYDPGHASVSIEGGGPGNDHVRFTVHWPDAVTYYLNVHIRGPKGLPYQ